MTWRRLANLNEDADQSERDQPEPLALVTNRSVSTHLVSSILKPYICRVCGAVFTAPSKLRRHMLRHTGEKPFECRMCKRKFALKDTLIKHIRTHTGEKPYKCPLCGRAFAQSGVLKSHVRTHAKELY